MEDWSLQAIVRESSGEFTKLLDSTMDDPDYSFFDVSGSHHHQHLDQEFFASFPEIFDVGNTYSDELEGLYKPFYPALSSLPPQTVLDFQEHGVENVVDEKQVCDQSSGAGLVARANPSYTPKYKKRKNQHKRVMVKVSAEGLSADMWAWRKYGQKPIKGSPYPRSYYRCSSSKGCLARKQVEQSCTDPGMFIITYTAEHSHSQPTRRNSLAGTVRQKFPTVKQEKRDESPTTTACSPNTPQQAMELSQASMNQEKKQEQFVCKDDEFIMSDFALDDDFFSGLQDFDEFVSESSLYYNSLAQSCS